MSVTTFSDPFDAAGAEPTAWWPSTTSGTILPTSLGSVPTPSSILSVLGISQRDKIIRELVDDGYWVKMTGSRVTKDGWTNESDWDYVVYDPDKKLRSKFLAEDGWVLGSDAGRGEFDSIKLNGVNLILVDKEEIWKKWVIATNLLKMMDPKTKEERIGIFDTVFGKTSDSKAMDFGAPF